MCARMSGVVGNGDNTSMSPLPQSDFYLVLERIKRASGAKVYPFDSEAIWYLTQALGLIMSEASEDMWRANWMSNAENIIPEMAAKDEIIHAKTMLTLANLLGHWARYHFDGEREYYMPHLPNNFQPAVAEGE